MLMAGIIRIFHLSSVIMLQTNLSSSWRYLNTTNHPVSLSIKGAFRKEVPNKQFWSGIVPSEFSAPVFLESQRNDVAIILRGEGLLMVQLDYTRSDRPQPPDQCCVFQICWSADLVIMDIKPPNAVVVRQYDRMIPYQNPAIDILNNDLDSKSIATRSSLGH